MFEKIFGRRKPNATSENQVPAAIGGDLAGRAAPSVAPPGTPISASEPDSASPFEGFHEGADLDLIWGWAWNSAHPDTPIDVDIYDGEIHLATVPANQFRPDLQEAGKGNGSHSFVYTPPMRLRDGQSHMIHITIAGTNIPLSQTPRQLRSEST
jgi:hypothetical protein